ncbi:carbohydrate ABC transporter permease, partial [Listeria monocytogenes]|nr:carbohydrate ABC transporter permease [Listeria monocytogenes]
MEMTTKTRSKSSQQRVKKIISYVVMSIIGIVLLIPLLWMVFTSLKPMEEIVRYPPTFFPEEINLGNYLETINAFPFWQYAKN